MEKGCVDVLALKADANADCFPSPWIHWNEICVAGQQPFLPCFDFLPSAHSLSLPRQRQAPFHPSEPSSDSLSLFLARVPTISPSHIPAKICGASRWLRDACGGGRRLQYRTRVCMDDALDGGEEDKGWAVMERVENEFKMQGVATTMEWDQGRGPRGSLELVSPEFLRLEPEFLCLESGSGE